MLWMILSNPVNFYRYLNVIPDSLKVHHTNQQLFDNGKDTLVKKLNDLNDIAKNRAQTLRKILLAWLLRDPVVASIIIGSTSVEHLDDNLKVLDNLDFSQDEIDAIDKLIK